MSYRCLCAICGAMSLVVASGCTFHEPAGAGPAALAAPYNESAKPGINQPYADQADADAWRARLEREDREVYAQRERIVADLRIRPGMTVADIGAGTGAFTELLAGRVGERGIVVAQDIFPYFLDAIDRRVAAAGFRNVRTILGDERSVRLPPASIDLALISDTYHHFEYPVAMLDSIRQALKPGGRLVIIDFLILPGPRFAWLVEHVRADREAVLAEVTAAGFDLVDDAPPASYLRENYWLEFRRR